MTTRDEAVEALLRRIDADCHRIGAPPLSACIVNDDGEQPVFWESVRLYDLRQVGETDEQVLIRLRGAAATFPYPFKVTP